MEHFDGRKLFIEHHTIITPGMKKYIEGEGMSNKDGFRGNLIITFLVKFPLRLTDTRKNYLNKLLPRNKVEVTNKGYTKYVLHDLGEQPEEETMPNHDPFVQYSASNHGGIPCPQQ
jgi:DnaJ-class molecular chaperone